MVNLLLANGAKIIQWTKNSLQQMARGHLDLWHMQKDKVGLLPHTVYKSWLKMDPD